MKKLFTLILLFIIPVVAKSQDYYVYVTAESDDQIHLIHFNAQTGIGELAKTIEVGRYPAENEGPHGINVSPDGKYVYVSIAHGIPYGFLQKIDAKTGELIAETTLGMFPASMEVSSITGFLYIVNFNLHGDMEPSTVSVVDPELMETITEVPTGIMPHGSRISSDGKWQYHVSMMTDELIEINTVTMEVQRRLNLVEGAADKPKMADHSGHDMSGMNHEMSEGMAMHETIVKPTWADPHPSKPIVYIAGNGSDEILEVNTNSWAITKRFKSGKAPYNLEVSPDGKLLVVSYKGEAKSGVWNLETGKELARIDNSRRITHGVAISNDSKFAFMSVEGVAGEPGSVDIIDLESLKRVAVVETGKQAGGIIFWKQN